MGYLLIVFCGFLVAVVVYIYLQLVRAKLPGLTKTLYILGFTSLLLICTYLKDNGFPRYIRTQGEILSPLAKPINKGIEVVRHILRSKEIETIVKEETQKHDGTYAVAIKNLKTGEEFFMDENKRFSSGSLYKLWVMAETYRQIDEGKFTLDTKMSDSVSNLNKRFGIASESAELKEGDISQTVQQALTQMITISANYPAYLLSSKVGTKNVRQFLVDNALSDSNVGSITTEPYTTPRDTFLFFEKLYKKELVSQKASEEMLELLKKQTLNDRIPKYLPKNTEVAHKTGELFGNKHNAGIVFSPKGDIIIVLFSKTKNETKAAEVEAQISKRVWEYFNR